MAMINERINIVPIIAADISGDGYNITNQFDEITIKKGAVGEFYIDFITSAVVNKKYDIRYVLVRKVSEGIEALHIDSFIISPSKEFLESRKASQKRVSNEWSFGKGQIIFGHTKVRMDYKTINKSGEYGILAFAKESESDTDDVELTPDNLICERHFFVNVKE